MELSFHPKRNLLWGPNGAGKSAVVKSLFRAFDAEPHGKLPGWDYQAIIAVDFEIDGVGFTSVRREDLRALFQGEKLIGAATSSRSWNKLFCEATGFNLRLLDRTGDFRHAAPANFFLPFFINQDGSFGTSWETFDGLRQFQNFPQHTLEYFLDIRPPEYFELKAREQGAKTKSADLKVELSTIQRTRVRLKRNQESTPVKLHQKDFQAEVSELTKRLSGLSKAQEELRRAIVEDQDLIISLNRQITLSEQALKEHAADFKFAAALSVSESKFVCPTCHAEHDDSFHTFLGLAEDARELSTLTKRLEKLSETASNRLERNRFKASSLRSDFNEIQVILAKKRGKFTFEDFINSRSFFIASKQLAQEESAIEKEVLAQSTLLKKIKLDLKKISEEHDAQTPLDVFREKFAEAIVVLDVNRPEGGVEKWTLAKRPNASGSRHARTIIAYYAALWNSIAQLSNIPAPLVIDSPNQGAQDKEHLQTLITSIASTAPSTSQIILSHEENISDYKADKTIHFNDKIRLLNSETFQRISSEIFQMVNIARVSINISDHNTDEDANQNE